jgi:hypothetical protein
LELDPTRDWRVSLDHDAERATVSDHVGVADCFSQLLAVDLRHSVGASVAEFADGQPEHVGIRQ